MNRITGIIIMISTLALSQTTDLYFSEYAEGSSNNKYIEIYNGTGSSVDLSNYAIVRYNNGSSSSADENLYTLSGTLVTGTVYIIANASADADGILPYNDDDGTNAGATWYNGNDYLGLIHDENGDGTFDNSSEVIDVIGVFGEDPGTGWPVAGVSVATAEHTLVRKASIENGNSNWTTSAGTNTTDSEWIVYPQNTWDYIGSHPHVDPAIAITSPTDGATFYSSDVTVSFDVSNFTVAPVGSGDGHIHYSLDGGTTVMQYTTADIALTGLSQTSHTFVIWLVDGSHANLTPHVVDTVSFTVSQIQIITMAEARNQAVGTNVTVRGIVTTPNFQSSNTEYGFQDPTAGTVIFHWGAPYVTLNVGDSVQVSGDIDEYSGKIEIVPRNASDITVISTGNSLPAFQEITVATLISNGEDYESELIKINNASITSGTWPTSGGSVNLPISDDGGVSEVDMRIDSDMNIIGNPEPAAPFVVQGIAGQFNDYQILPRYYADFIPAGGTPPVISGVAINPSSPTEVDDVIVSVTITDDGTITSATLTYNAGTTDNDVTMTNTAGDTYTGTIPAQTAGTTVTYSITVVDNDGNSATSASYTYLVISTGGAITSIYDIQYVSDPGTDDASPLDGQIVTISGVVTAEFWGSSGNRALYIQDAEGPWNGIYAYKDGWDSFDFITSSGIVHSVAEGDSVTLTGTVDEYVNLTEIVDVTEVIIHGPAVNLISPSVVTPAQVMTGGSEVEAYEGCLVKVENVTVDDASLGNGEWSISDGTNSMRVDDIWDYYFFPETGQALDGVVGVMTYTFSNAKLEPRLARDVVESDVTRIQRINQVLYSDLLKVVDDNVSDNSYYMGTDTFTVEGIVTVATGLAYAGSGVKLIFEDYNGGPWSGLVCYSADPTALGSQPIGRKIRATGTISEYGSDSYDGNVSEIDITQPIQVLGFDPTAVPVDTVNTGDFLDPLTAEQWGAVWIEINDATVLRNDLDYGQWTIDNGTGEIKIGTNSESEEWDDWQRPPVGSFVQSIRGWVYHRHGYYSDSTAYKLEPNYPSDIIFGAGPPIIAEVQRDPCVVIPTDQVQVSAEITDNSVISQAFVHYRFGGGAWDSSAMTPGTDDIWSGDIPSSSNDNVFVEYYISGYDDGVEQDGLIKSSHFPNIEDGNYMGYKSTTGDLTIYDIQYSPWPSGVSPYIDCNVTITGIVTSDSVDYLSGSYNSYAMQSESAQWSGLFFDGSNLPGLTRGDEITITGKVYEYYGSTSVDSVTAVSILSSNNVILPLGVSTADLAENADEVEAYEGCLVTVSDVEVSAINTSSSGTTIYDWSIKDDSNISCLVDDDMATMAADNYMSGFVLGTTLETVSGIFNFSFGEYKIEVRDMADLGQLGIDDNFDGITREFALYPNYPNPFNPETRIRFQLAKHSNVELMIYDVLGRKVRTLLSNKMDAGNHAINWDGLNDKGASVASGMYIYRIKADNFIAHRKMLLVR